MNGWQVPLIVVDRTLASGERAALARDHARGIVQPVRPRVWVRSIDVADLRETEDRHPVRMRALAAVSADPPVFSHWSAEVALGMSPYRRWLDRVDVLVDPRLSRARVRVRAHVQGWTDHEVVERHGLLVTDVPRTVVDVAIASPRGEGVAAADEALFRGLPRAALEEAVDLASGRKSVGRARDAIAFGHPGAESAAESEERWSLFLLGVEPPELQVEIRDDRGLAGVVDSLHRGVRAGMEIDGAKKYLANGGTAAFEEKRREDRVRAQLDAFGRCGWREATDPVLLRPLLRRLGVVPAASRPTLGDYAAAARLGVPRRPAWI